MFEYNDLVVPLEVGAALLICYLSSAERITTLRMVTVHELHTEADHPKISM